MQNPFGPKLEKALERDGSAAAAFDFRNREQIPFAGDRKSWRAVRPLGNLGIMTFGQRRPANAHGGGVPFSTKSDHCNDRLAGYSASVYRSTLLSSYTRLCFLSVEDLVIT